MFEKPIHSRRVAFWISLCAVVICAAVITSCDSSDGARIVGATGTPSLIGEWKGTMTATSISGVDTLLVRTFNVRITFDDSTFSYRYIDSYGYIIPPYSGTGPYEHADSTVHLYDTTSYSETADRTLTPIADEPYTLTFDRSTATLVWFHLYGDLLYREQRFVLVRS